MTRRRLLRIFCALVMLSLILPGGGTRLAATPNPESAAAATLVNRSFFGMNLYITGLERPKAEKLALLSAAQDLGVRWSREEMSWANLEATVLIGGLSVHDYNNQGMAFLNRVVADSGGKLNFDVLSIHPYMPDRPPESTDPNTVVQNFPYRLRFASQWLQAHGAANKEIWITEDGYSTCTSCGNLGVSEDEQAARLVRLY